MSIHVLPLLGTCKGFQNSNPQSCPAHTQVVDRTCPLYGELSVTIQKAWLWTIVGNMFCEGHALCTIKTSFVNLAHCSRYKRQVFSSLQSLHIIPVEVKSCWPRWPMTPLFLYIHIVIIYCLICSLSEYSWNTTCWTLTICG